MYARFIIASLLGSLGIVAVVHLWQHLRAEPAPSFEFGSTVSVVSIRAASGKYLEVSSEDGIVRATATSPDSNAARFRVHVLSAEAVRALKLAASSMHFLPSTGGMRTIDGCQCSGFSNEHGFGRFCHPWEDDMQAPWCYVGAHCKTATIGSFGRRHQDCSVLARDDELGGAPSRGPPMESSTSSSRRLQQQQPPPPWPLKSHDTRAEDSGGGSGAPRLDPHEASLLESVERLRQPHVALVSLATEGFVSVELPPHRLAMRPHARTDALSLRGVFSFLPGGQIMSLSTNALLNLCPEPPLPGAVSKPASAENSVCTAFVDADSAHPKLLRSSSDVVGRRASFKVERRERQPAPKPKPAASVRPRRAGHNGRRHDTS